MSKRFGFLLTTVIGGVVILLIFGVVVIFVNLFTGNTSKVSIITAYKSPYTINNVTVSRIQTNEKKIDYNFIINK